MDPASRSSFSCRFQKTSCIHSVSSISATKKSKTSCRFCKCATFLKGPAAAFSDFQEISEIQTRINIVNHKGTCIRCVGWRPELGSRSVRARPSPAASVDRRRLVSRTPTATPDVGNRTGRGPTPARRTRESPRQPEAQHSHGNPQDPPAPHIGSPSPPSQPPPAAGGTQSTEPTDCVHRPTPNTQREHRRRIAER